MKNGIVPSKLPGHSIAVIGMACEFPDAHSPEQLWDNVLAGRRAFRKAPPERLPADYFDPNPEAPGKSYCDQMAVLTGWAFDPVELGIPPVTYQATDLAHWLALDVASKALRDANLGLEKVQRARVGVILGNSLTGEFFRSHILRFRWPYVERSVRRALASKGIPLSQLDNLVAAVRREYEAPLPDITEDSLSGNMANTIAGRICNYFDFGAGGYIVDGACASSLLSISAACNALANGEMDFALAGGVDISLDPFEIVGFAKTRALAADDIRPYDQRAAGMLTGEGCGIVVLAREKEARAAGYPVRALIRGWGCSSDGAGALTAPEVEGQLRALRRAYERAGYPAQTVALIEGHGTGTSLGDKVEIAALRRLLEEAPGEIVCRIGSLKANIGHCKAAAGSAGLIKTIMALQRGIFPPTLNCREPNSAFGLPSSRLRPSTQGLAWPMGPIPRRASVSAMGFGGINAHVTLEEAGPRNEIPQAEAGQLTDRDRLLLGSAQSSELVVLAADEPEQLRKAVEKLLPLAHRLSRAELTDLSAALCQKPLSAKLRLALVAESPWDLARMLDTCAKRLAAGASVAALDDPAQGVFAGIAGPDPKWVALFPGQSAQRLNMGEAWRQRFPFVREYYRKVAESGAETSVCRSLEQNIFRDLWSADATTRQAWEQELRETSVAQPAIVLSSLAAFEVLRFFGLQPHFAIGHSLGELSALAAAGVWDPLLTVELAARRGAAMSTPAAVDARGGMTALDASPEEAQRLLQELGQALTISNYNSPRQTVVSGPLPALEDLASLCKQRKIACRQLAVSHAFHSDLVAPASAAFNAALRQWLAKSGLHPWPPPAATLFSTVTGRSLCTDDKLLDHLTGQIRKPVRFTEAVHMAAAEGPALWIEVGPGATLSGLIRAVLGPSQAPCLPIDLPGEDSFDLLNRVLARAWVLGLRVRLERLFTHRFCRPLNVEDYQPRFIVNPCERPTEGGAALSKPASDGAKASSPELPQQLSPDRETLLAFTLDWISRRSGFPKSMLSADERLREDLNLDSIKAGELVLLLAQKIGCRFEGDPAMVASGRICDVVDAVLARAPKPDSGASPAPARESTQDPIPGLAEWTRSFRSDFMPIPLDGQTSNPLPASSACVIVAQPGCLRAGAIAQSLRQLGLAPQILDPDCLARNEKAPEDLDLLLLFLPEAETPFMACRPEEFAVRLETTAKTLFQVFRWAGRGRENVNLRGLVLRPARVAAGGAWDSLADSGSDLDGGAGLLKSLAQEYPAADFKWLVLPAQWPPARWAEVALRELQSGTGRRIAFMYSPDGQRLAETAILCQQGKTDAATGASGLPALPLGPQDVVLVSGGAKGITCELALALARETNVRLALLGSSPAPGKSAGSSRDEISRNLERLEQCGIRHLYLQADVTDLAAVRRAVHDAEQALGPITAILHGAGITRLRPFQEKTLEEFLECLRVKALGFYHLLAAVPMAQLKAVHVISSVLGKTGMRGQTDYTFANAWLDGAVRALKAGFPKIQCLSLGFSAWTETGLARRVGALDSLRALGVLPISIEAGVAAYLDLLRHPQADGVYVITGRLTPDFEAGLYAPAPPPRGRYLEQLRRWIPGVELVAEARLSHRTDPYLAEHVFEGTPIFPGVMAIEAMTQAAMACTGRTELPALREVRFHTPLIVPDSGNVTLRMLALAEIVSDGVWRVRVAGRSNHDGFSQNHFEAECWFGSAEDHVQFTLPQPMPEPLDEDPEQFSPVPLFQGKFFRRIELIRQRIMGRESLTEIQVPVHECYFQGLSQPAPLTPSPVARDACWQSGALVLPPGCLPRRLGELRFHAKAWPKQKVLCQTWIRDQSLAEFVTDLAVFTPDGRLLESMRGLVFQPVASAMPVRHLKEKSPPCPLPLDRVPGDLRALLPETPHGIAFVPHQGLSSTVNPESLAQSQLAPSNAKMAVSPQVRPLANLMATRGAALACARQTASDNRVLGLEAISLEHDADGKPELRVADPAVTGLFQGMEVSLTHGSGFSLAWLAPVPAATDLEAVKSRDAETWRGLLGADGYELALRLSAETAEPFDWSATRVWTLLEAGKKANKLKRLLPQFESALGGPWLGFVADNGEGELKFLSTTLTFPQDGSDFSKRKPASPAVLTVAAGRAPAPSASDRTKAK